MRPCSKSWSIVVPASWEFRALAATCGVCVKPPRQRRCTTCNSNVLLFCAQAGGRDEARNRSANNPINDPASRCSVLVLASQEDEQIARHTWALFPRNLFLLSVKA